MKTHHYQSNEKLDSFISLLALVNFVEREYKTTRNKYCRSLSRNQSYDIRSSLAHIAHIKKYVQSLIDSVSHSDVR